MDGMWFAILGVLTWHNPKSFLQIQIRPYHAPDLIPTLACQGQHLHDWAKWKPNLAGRFQNFCQLPITQHAMSRLLSGRRGDPGARGNIEDASTDAPVEELANRRQHPIGHDR
ncbi:hypothetical protein AAII07_56460 [Microvirga sp. 0TCS3.31]